MGVGSESWEAGGGQALGNEGDILLPAQPVPPRVWRYTSSCPHALDHRATLSD